MEVAAPELAAPEVLVCDTSYISHFERSLRNPDRYRHWPATTLDRISAAILAITPFTLGEVRAGYVTRSWGAARIAQLENRLRGYVLIPLDLGIVDEYAKLHAQCRDAGISIGQNDLWIAATAVSQDLQLVTCDSAQAALPGVDAIYLPAPAVAPR
jgi:predicted nucleic acid-binding protein